MNIDVYTTRRENLRRLVRDRFEGNKAALARASEVHENHIRLLLSDNEGHARLMKEDMARKIERNLDLAHGFLDTPSTSVGSSYPIPGREGPAELAHIITTDNVLAHLGLYDSYLQTLSGRITTKEALMLFRVATDDMAPELERGDHILLDTGVRAVTTDGIYIIDVKGSTFLRRVTKKMTGGLEISQPGQEPMPADRLRQMRSLGRVAMVIRPQLL